MSKQEKRRLERLKKELDNQQKKLDQDKKKFAIQKKESRDEKQKLERQQKQLQQKVRKFQLSQSSGGSSGGRSGKSRGGGKTQVELNKTKGELKDTKDQLNKAKKNVRELRKSVDDKEALIKSLQRQLKKAGRGKKEVGDDKIVKQLKREIANLKKRLKLALRDLDKQARYYQQQLKRFKQDQQKWITRQRDVHKKKGVVVKYVFIDDIRKIKVYKKGRNRIKVKTVDGGEVIIKDVQIVEASEVEEAAADVIDEVTQEIEAEFKKKRKKKKKKKKGDNGQDEVEEEEEEEEEEPQNLDDIKEDEEDKFEDYTDEIYSELMGELSYRTRDLHRINEIYCGDEEDTICDRQFKELWESVVDRHNKWTIKMSDSLKYDLSDELPELNKNWQDEIYKVKDSIIIIKRRSRKKGKKEGIEEATKTNDNDNNNSNNNNNNDEKNEIEYLVAAKDQMITELNGRISDLTQLNGIYFHPEDSSSILSKQQQVEELLNNLESRHESIINELSELPPSTNAIDELLPENNHQWKSLIYETGTEMNQNDAEPLRLELELRTKDLDVAVKVVNNKQPIESLNSLIEDIDKRTKEKKKKNYNKQLTKQEENEEKDGDEWLTIMKSLQIANDKLQNELNDAKAQVEASKLQAEAQDNENKNQNKKQDFSPVAQAQKVLIKDLLTEMDNRRRDLNNLSNLQKNADGDGNVVGQAEKLRVDAIKRHQKQNNNLHSNLRALSAAAKASTDSGDGDKDIQDAIQSIEQDNKKWQNQLNKLVDDTKNIDDLKKRNKAAITELNGRIVDVLKMKDLYDSANNKTNNNARQEAERQFESLQNAVKDRHQHVEQNMKESIDIDNNDDDKKDFVEITENDQDWRDAIFNTASHITELDEPKEVIKNKPQYEEIKPQRDEIKEEEKIKKKAIYDDEQKEWWLDKDSKRRNFIDNILVDEKQRDILCEISAYCDRVLYHPNTDDMGVATDLYFPIPQQDNHHILSVFYDGTMLCDLVNRINPDYVDKRVINYPDPFDAYPLNDKQVLENSSLLLSAAKSMGVEMVSYDAEDWMNGDKHTNMFIELMNGLHEKLLDSKMDLKRNPELCRLIKNGEDPFDIENMTGSKWLSRWMNQKNGKGLIDEIDSDKWNNSTYNTMKQVSPIFNNASPVNNFNDDTSKASMSMITHVTNKSPTGTSVRPNDLNNNKYNKIHKYFSTEAYFVKSGLSALNDSEKNKYSKYLKKAKKTDEDTYINWINAMLPAHLHVNILTRDLSDGVVLLKLLEKGKIGCVNWKKAREKVRHKFDKLNNCNMVMSLSQLAPFNFSLVGMGGNDIVDGQQKFVSTLLWQLMRYQAVKQISELSFGGKTVTDQDILQWANVTIVRNQDAQSKQISSFKDRRLTTCIFYTELLAAIRPNDVDMTLLSYDVRPLVNNRVDDKFRNERIDNARLAMSYVRKFGGDLFVLPEHLCMMDAKAVLSMFAAIMTVGMTDNAYTGTKSNKRVNDALLGY